MWRHYKVVILTAVTSVALASPSAMRAQRHGGGGMGPGMMGMAHDSATMALMATSHQLLINHDRITRTVTKLPNGVRTVTESNDPVIAALIKAHVATTVQRVQKGDDPHLPMETPALRAIFANGGKIKTSTDTTAKGVVVVQTSNDSAAVAALWQHASEVTDLVDRGMAAMHASMMRRGNKPH